MGLFVWQTEFAGMIFKKIGRSEQNEYKGDKKVMGYLELLLIGVGLAMDAFAVSICKGLNMKTINKKHCFIIALFFGGFQALMPFIGWLAGIQFEHYIKAFDHWIAFVLLVVIGGHIVVEVFRGEDEEDEVCLCAAEASEEHLDIKELFLLAIATSIDALAVGVTFAFLQVEIVPAIIIIGSVTFVISAAGVFIGNIFGSKYKSRAELAGGIILILLGIKILLEHLGIV